MDFIRFRRTDRAALARPNISAGGPATFRWQPGLAAPSAPFPFTANRPILNLYAPRRCGDSELQRSHHFDAPSKDALSRWSALPGAQTLCPLHSPPEASAGVLVGHLLRLPQQLIEGVTFQPTTKYLRIFAA